MTDQKPYGPPPDAIPLSDAMKEFLPAEMWEEHARATEARKNTPKRPSYLSMSVRDWQDAKDSHDAANRTRSARADLHRVWNGMLAAMKAKLEAGGLPAFGQKDPPFGPWHAIPAPAWRQLRITNVRKGEASDTGSTEPSRKREADWLLRWFRAHHPGKEPPTVKTIYNNLPAGFFAEASK
mgnify:CR=1 FL=1